MAEAIMEGAKMVSARKNVTLSLSSHDLPQETLEALGVPLPCCENPSNYSQNKWEERFAAKEGE
jgi:hypothetical protein